MNNEVIKRQIKSILLNLIGSSMLAFGVCAFVEPFHIIVGGSTGIALVLHRLTGMNVSVFALALNILVLPIGYFFYGKELVIGSILSSLFFPMSLAVFEQIPVITTIADNIMLASICGGIVCGAGIGIVMRSGGSTGGMDIPVLVISKLFHKRVDMLINVFDTIIMVCQIPFSNITFVIYGVI